MKPSPRAAQTTTGEKLRQSGIHVSARYGLDSGVQFQRLDARGIGIQAVLDAGFIDAVDVWGYAEQGVEICFPEQGSLIFLDAATSPRRAAPLPAYNRSGMTCAELDRAGTVVLVSRPAPLPATAEAMVTLQNCQVTTTHILNFRASPAGDKIKGLIPYRVTLTAMARIPDWFQVDYHGTVGWISADYVQMQGMCG